MRTVNIDRPDLDVLLQRSHDEYEAAYGHDWQRVEAMRAAYRTQSLWKRFWEWVGRKMNEWGTKS